MVFQHFIDNNFDEYKTKIFLVRNVVLVCGIIFSSTLFLFDPYFNPNPNLFSSFKAPFYLGLGMFLLAQYLLIKYRPSIKLQNYLAAAFFFFLGTVHVLFYWYGSDINNYYHNLGFILIIVYFNLFLFVPIKLNLPIMALLFAMHILIYLVKGMPGSELLLLMSLSLAIAFCCLFINHLITKSFLDNVGYLSTAIKLAYTDELTHLHNRRAFNYKLNQLIKKYDYQSSFAMLILDLDNFKSINDTYGHDVGDLAIKKLAQILKMVETKKNNIAARFGGDEFILFLNGYDINQVKITCQVLLSKINQIVLDGENNFLKTSIGVAFAESMQINSLKASAMLKLADKALYKLKRNNQKNRYYIYRFNQTSEHMPFHGSVVHNSSDSVIH